MKTVTINQKKIIFKLLDKHKSKFDFKLDFEQINSFSKIRIFFKSALKKSKTKEQVFLLIQNLSEIPEKIETCSNIAAEELLRFSGKNTKTKKICILLCSEKIINLFFKTFSRHAEYITKKTYRNPIPTVDIIIEKNPGIILIKRKNPPFGWAIPGGFVDYGESLETAAKREAKEETSLTLKNIEQFRCYSDPKRDPRYHTISTVFTAKIKKGFPKAASDAKEIRIFKLENLPEDIAFDHKKILLDYKKHKENIKKAKR